MGIGLFLIFIVLLLSGTPIAICLGVANFAGLSFFSDINLMVIVQRLYSALDSFPLLCIPFFMVGGEFMERGGISRRLINLGNSLVGHLPGGFAMVCVVACTLFAAMSGSGPATTAAIGSILIPAMIKEGYGSQFAASLQSVAGSLGPIIPPSILFVTYGVTTDTSIGALFVAGIIPGLMLALSWMAIVFIISLKRGLKGTVKFKLKNVFKSFYDAIFALLVPVIILGGIYGGIFTPTEAAAVAALYALFVGAFIYKELDFKGILQALFKGGINSGMVMIMVATAFGFTWILAKEQIPAQVAQFLINVAPNGIILLLLINIILLISGCFVELNASILILAPILLPVAEAIGIDPIQFGAIMIVNLSLGLVTPPLGINLYVAAGITPGMTIEKIAMGVIPFLLVAIGVLLIITYVPWCSMFLPNLLGF